MDKGTTLDPILSETETLANLDDKNIALQFTKISLAYGFAESAIFDIFKYFYSSLKGIDQQLPENQREERSG